MTNILVAETYLEPKIPNLESRVLITTEKVAQTS